MKKEPKSLNTFLEPIVDELKALWKGVKLTTSQSGIPLTYRGALLLASADLPADLSGTSNSQLNFEIILCLFFSQERNDLYESSIMKSATH